MKRKRKYKKRQFHAPAKAEAINDLATQVKTLLQELIDSYTNTLLSIRRDLLRARGRIKERQEEEKC